MAYFAPHLGQFLTLFSWKRPGDLEVPSRESSDWQVGFPHLW